MKVIHTYTADQAVEDGVLHPCTTVVNDEDLAQQAGFRWPIRITSGVLSLVEVPDKLEGVNDLKGRMFDMLFLASLALRREKSRAEAENREMKTIIPFKVAFQMQYGGVPYEVELWLAPDYTSGPALHIMLPEEY